MSDERLGNTSEHPDVVVVGAGFAGLYMVHRLVSNGFDVVGIERGSDVGGTWYWNRYPGARCDVESMEYSYSFSEELQQEWDWSERYSSQSEILRYVNHVADRFDLRRHYRFDTSVIGARFDDRWNGWTVMTATGKSVRCRYLVLAVGCLSTPHTPDVDRLSRFEGETYHTGTWPHRSVEFAGKRVAVIGTGSSGVQAIPLIAVEAASLTVFQRTPNYTVPAHNRRLGKDELDWTKANYSELRAANRRMQAALGAGFGRPSKSVFESTRHEREARFGECWDKGGFGFLSAYNDLLLNQTSNDYAARYIRTRIREVVKDPEVAESLMPDSVVGCKRLCIDTGYYETFNRANVSLVDVRKTPIERFTTTGIVAEGLEHTVDAVVFATGFDAMTGSLLAMDIVGTARKRLRDHWEAGPRTYLGLAVSGFPNMFTICGPGSPSVLTNMLMSIEQHVEWISDFMKFMQHYSWNRVEAQCEAETQWGARVNAIADLTLYPNCNSWYLGANIPGKPRTFMPYFGFPSYCQECEAVVEDGYRGFTLRR